MLYPNRRYELILVDEKSLLSPIPQKLLHNFKKTTQIFEISLHIRHPKIGTQSLTLKLDRTWDYTNTLGTHQPEMQMKYLDESLPQQFKLAGLNS